jgi:hypothetical protein
MFFTFPKDARWECRPAGGGLRGQDRRVQRRGSGSCGASSGGSFPERPTPERCVEAYYLQRTRFESIAGRKPRRGN